MRCLLPFLSVPAVLAAAPALAQPDRDDDEPAPPLTEIVVTAQRLDVARARIEPSLGASTYTLSNEAVENRPSGETTNLAQILLQAPGVTQSGGGQLRVRSQASLQYRINNVILPEGLTDIGESLSARLAERVELITGALPAQYGLQVGGIVNVTTKNGAYGEGGQVELYGGSHGEVQPAFEYAGAVADTNLFVSGSYLGSDTGLASPDGSGTPSHDHTDQFEGFAFLDRILDDETRISLILGMSNERFQIPYAENPLDAGGSQRGTSQYGVVSYLRSGDRFTLQVSGFARYSTLGLHPVADDARSGQTVADRDFAGGLQVEGVYDASAEHTLRAGLTASSDHEKSMPDIVVGVSSETRREISAFIQDEWKPLEGLTVNAGLRLDHVNTSGGNGQVSPRINLVWSPAEGTTVHAGYARYFVPPPLDGNFGAPPSPKADPARAESDDYYDVGVEQKLGGLTVGLDGYWRDAANLIDFVPVGAGALPRSFNYAIGRVRGVEFSATYAEGPFSAWADLAIGEGKGQGIVSNRFSFTSADLVFARRNFVNLSQDQTCTASAGASYKWGPARLSTDLIYGSGLRRTAQGGAPNAAVLPDYVQVNAAMVYRMEGLGGQPLDLRLDAINLLDRRYALRDGSSLGGGVPQWGPRRGVFIGVEQSF